MRVSVKRLTVLVVAVLAVRAAPAETIYLETFNQSVTSGTGTSLHDVGPAPQNATGWLAWFQQTAGANVVQPTDAGFPYVLASAKLPDSTIGADGLRSFVFGGIQSAAIDSEFVFATDEYTVNRAEWDVTSFEWLMRNTHTGYQARVAIQINGQWYASDAVFQVTTADTWQLQTFAFSTQGSAWRNMTFTTGTGGDIAVAGSTLAGSLPSGNIDAFGLYFRSNATGSDLRLRFDNFTIKADVVPEPASWLLLLPAGVGLLACRRRKNRQARGA
jgi:hypothetical protein